MIIQNGLVYDTDFRFRKKDVFIKDGCFCEGSDMNKAIPDEIIDASGCYVIPGLIDIHFHGCMGRDFCDGTAEAIQALADYELAHGITAMCPATLTLPAQDLLALLGTAASYVQKRKVMSSPTGADLIGINMEGPFISREKKGAQNGTYILPCSVGLAEDFLEASQGLVKLIGLAPEVNPGFETFLHSLQGKVRLSLAHTNADYNTAMRAFTAGASHAVHLFNAMPEMTHRAPGVVGAVRDCPHVFAELICDGIHVHPCVVRAAFDMLSEERIVLISDSLRATGMGDGRILLGGQWVEVQGPKARLAQGGNLAGSVSNLMDCLRTAVFSMGISLERAVRCTTYNPAKAIGAEDSYGSIRPGQHANAVLLKQTDLTVLAVIKDGGTVLLTPA